MKEKNFRKVENIAEYVREGIKSGKLTIEEVAKFARIHARQGELGEEIVTIMANGLEETRNTVTLDEKTGEPGWVVTNPDGEEYIVSDSTFKKKYEIDPENPEQYKPKGGPVLSTQIDEDIEFEAPWGGAMDIEAGGSLILSGPDDIYGIQKEEFENTYASTGRDSEETLYQAKLLLDMINTIDIQKLGAEIGIEAKEQTLPNGKVVNQLVWNQESLLKAVEAVKHLSEEGKPVRITGAAPAWLVSALTHTVHPCPVALYQPAVGKDIQIPQLAHGKANPEGEVTFKITEKGNSVLIEYNMNLPEGITTYDEKNLSKVIVPEIPQGKAVYLSGRGPNYLTTAIAEAYAHTNSSVSLFQPGVGYTCSITHSRDKKLGDCILNPLGVEKIKEELYNTKRHEDNGSNPGADNR